MIPVGEAPVHPPAAETPAGVAPTESAGALARLMAVYVVVAVGKIGDLLSLNAVPLAKIVAALAIIVAIRNKAALAPVRVMAIPPAKLTVLFMVLVTVSISFSVLRSGTLEVITGTVLAVLVAQTLIVKAARSWAAVRTMLLGAVASALILAATVMSTRLADTTGLRAGYSQSYDPNDFAFVLVGLWPLVVSFCVLSRGRARLVYFGVALWVLVALLLTQSRGGFLGLLADVALLAFLLPVVRKGKVDFHPSKAAMVVRIGFLAIVGMLAWQFVPNAARARLETVSQLGSDYNASVGHGGRLEIWSRTLPLAASRPWGYGAGGFETADGMFAGGRFRAPHNTFLQALIELGVLGFGLFIAIIVKSLRYLGRVSSDLERPQQHAVELQLFARALGICLVGLCVSGFFLSQLYSNIVWTIVALICALGFVMRRSASRVDTRANTSQAPDGLPFKTVG